MIIAEAGARNDKQIADMSPLVEVALEAVGAKLTEQRKAVVAADAKRFEETEMDEPSTKTLALLDKKLEAIGNGKTQVRRDTRAALGYLSEAVNSRPAVNRYEQMRIADEKAEAARVIRETAAERDENERTQRAYALNGAS